MSGQHDQATSEASVITLLRQEDARHLCEKAWEHLKRLDPKKAEKMREIARSR